MGPLSAGPMKSVKSLIDRRQEIEQQLHAMAMRQPPSQTVKSPDGHLVIHAPFDIQDLKKRGRLKSQLARIDFRLQRWRMDEKGPSYLKIGGKVLYRLEDVRLYELSCRVKTAASS